MIFEDQENFVKRKGRFEYKRMPHQNISKLCVPMAAEAFFLENKKPLEFLQELKERPFEEPEDDPKFLFMISTKIPRSSRLVTCPVKIDGYEYDLKYGYSKLPNLREIKQDSFEQDMEIMHISKDGSKEIHLGEETEQNRVARYHVSSSTEDPFLIKVMPPLESKLEAGERMFNLEAGFHVNMCSNANDFDWDKLNWDYYVREVEKLIDLPERSIADL